MLLNKKCFGVLVFITLFVSTMVFAQGFPFPRIGGTVTVNGTLLSQADGVIYSFAVTRPDGTQYDPAAQSSGLSDAGMYRINIPIYDAVNYPEGANPGDTAVVRVYRSGIELAVIQPADGEFAVGASGSTTRIDIVAVSPTPAVTLTPAALAFGNQNVGNPSAARTATLTNTGNAVLNITGITASGDFAQTNTCGATLAAAANCTIRVVFTPTSTGNRTGQITVNSNAASSPNTVALTGTGTAVTTYAVTFTAGSGGRLTGDTTQTVNAGDDCTPVRAVPDAGYMFSGWSGDATGTANPLTVTNVTGPMNIQANFIVAAAADASPIPTLTEWGMIILSILILIFGIAILRKGGGGGMRPA